MADGIQQAAPGAVVTYQNNANADAGGDSNYDLVDIIAKALPSGDFISNTTFEPSYRSRATIQSGDGIGVATTTLRIKRATLLFDSGKTLAYSTVGSSSRITNFGDKVVTPSGKPGGKNGPNIILGAAPIFRGILNAYDALIRNAGTGAINIIPGTAGLSGELIDCTIETTTGAGNFAISSGSIFFPYMYNVVIVLGGTGVVTQFVVTYAELIKVVVGGTGAYCFNTGGVVRIRGLVLSGSPTTADMRASGAVDWDLVDFEPTDAVKMVDDVCVPNINFWALYLPFICATDALAGLADCPVKVLDGSGNIVVPVTYTNTLGLITHGIAGDQTQDAVKVRSAHAPVGTVLYTEYGDFTFRYNLDGTVLPGYVGQEITCSWPRTLGANSVRLKNIFDTVVLQRKAGPTASFSANATGGDSPLSVQFTDESIPGDEPITNWLWQFGDGATSTAQNPLHVYAEGTYSVSLTVTTSVGSDTKTRISYVVVEPPPPSGAYVRKTVPGTQFSPNAAPVTAFDSSDVAPVGFVRGAGPDGAYAPCHPGEQPTGFDHQVDPSTPFTPGSIPDTTYVECGEPIPGKVILLVPGMVMRLSST